MLECNVEQVQELLLEMSDWTGWCVSGVKGGEGHLIEGLGHIRVDSFSYDNGIAYLIFVLTGDVGDPLRFFKKEGRRYHGLLKWDGPFREVTKRTITVYTNES